jgi:hypothetical protein
MPYWYACFGQKPTRELLDMKIRQYPAKWTATRTAKARSEIGRFKHVFDCVNLVKWACWPKDALGYARYQKSQDVSADGLSKISPGGSMSTLPEIPGVLVFMKGHVGVYIGGGRVVEAYGFKNVANRPISAQKWTRWGRCPWVRYPSAPAPDKPVQSPTDGLCVGDRVRIRTNALNYYPGGVKVPAWLKGQVKTVDQVLHNGRAEVRGGEQCVLIDANGVNSWISIKNVDKVKE